MNYNEEWAKIIPQYRCSGNASKTREKYGRKNVRAEKKEKENIKKEGCMDYCKVII